MTSELAQERKRKATLVVGLAVALSVLAAITVGIQARSRDAQAAAGLVLPNFAQKAQDESQIRHGRHLDGKPLGRVVPHQLAQLGPPPDDRGAIHPLLGQLDPGQDASDDSRPVDGQPVALKGLQAGYFGLYGGVIPCEPVRPHPSPCAAIAGRYGCPGAIAVNEIFADETLLLGGELVLPGVHVRSLLTRWSVNKSSLAAQPRPPCWGARARHTVAPRGTPAPGLSPQGRLSTTPGAPPPGYFVLWPYWVINASAAQRRFFGVS